MDDASKRKVIIILSIVFIVFMLVAFYFFKRGDNFNSIKENKSNYLVYTKLDNSTDDFIVMVPCINIKGDFGRSINTDIDKFTDTFINNQLSTISYEYDISGDVLSVIIKVIDYDTESTPEVHFKSYNINLVTLELYSNDQLLHLFGVDYSDVEKIVEGTFGSYYTDIVNNNYYNSEECDYDCFLIYRGFDNYLDDISYYVRGGNLVAFKPFQAYSIFGEEDYFTDKNFEILITESFKKE